MISAGISLEDLAKGAGAGLLLPFMTPLTGAAAAFVIDTVTSDDDEEVQAAPASAPNETPDKAEQDDSYSGQPTPRPPVQINPYTIGRNVGHFDDDASTFLSIFAPGMREDVALDLEATKKIEQKGKELTALARHYQSSENQREFAQVASEISEEVLTELRTQIDPIIPQGLGDVIVKMNYTYVPLELIDFAQEYQEVMTDPHASSEKRGRLSSEMGLRIAQYREDIKEYRKALADPANAGAVAGYEATQLVAQLQRRPNESESEHAERVRQHEEYKEQHRELHKREMPGSIQGNFEMHEGLYRSLVELSNNPNINLLEYGLEVHPEFSAEEEDMPAESPDPAPQAPAAPARVANYRPAAPARRSAAQRLKSRSW